MIKSKWVRVVTFITIGIIISELITFLIAHLNNFKVADLGGYYYTRFVAPAAGVAAAIAALLAKKAVAQKSFHLYASGWLIASMLAFHTFMFFSGLMPGYYVMPAGVSVEKLDTDSLFSYTNSPNDELRWQAIYAILDRAQHEPSLAWELLHKQRSQDPQYLDSAVTISVVEMLSKLQDPSVIPVLEEMLASKEQVVLIENGAVKRSYPTRKVAKRLLSIYFGKNVDVETEEGP